jgi:hypothetical protein
MTEADLVNAVIGFSSPSITKPLKMKKAVEANLTRLIPQLSAESTAKILHKFGRMEKGSKILVEGCLNRMYSLT